MRALLVVNPAATTASPRTREVLLAAIEGELKLEVVETAYRGHATELAHQARLDGLDTVIALGGDGTVNEVVNGLLSEGPHPGVPDLAVVPGGGTNVFARALGIPRDPVEATGALLRAMREGTRRRVGLGKVDDRWFTFNAGLGWDAEVVDEVDKLRRTKQARTSARDYANAALRRFFAGTDRRHPALTVRYPDQPELDDDEGLHLVMVANTAPWTYLGARPIGPFPRASFETGLDLYALRTLRTVATLRQVRQVLSRRQTEPRGRAALNRHDMGVIEVTAERQVALQVDGEPLGTRDRVVFRAVPEALRVVAPTLAAPASV
jgi:diacylglycerol kinase family enzyme